MLTFLLPTYRPPRTFNVTSKVETNTQIFVAIVGTPSKLASDFHMTRRRSMVSLWALVRTTGSGRQTLQIQIPLRNLV